MCCSVVIVCTSILFSPTTSIPPELVPASSQGKHLVDLCDLHVLDYGLFALFI
jgi:hypothetical protein